MGRVFKDANCFEPCLLVRDLDKMAAQLQAAGIAVKIDPQSYPNGRFARLHDPEGIPSNCGSLRLQTLKAI